MYKSTKFIWITTQFEGFHYYPDAPEDVAFLRNKHRHIFHVKISIEVSSLNRELEFFQCKRFIENKIKENDFDNKSCEMISEDLFNIINQEYPNRTIKIEVSEDGENGSEIIYELL